MAKKLSSQHPMAALSPAELMADAVAHGQMEDAVQRALVAHDKAKNRAKSRYGQRILSEHRTTLLLLMKRLRRWDKYIQEGL